MFGYYCNLALRSLKRNTVLTVLMMLAIALGIGATMTTLTIYRSFSANPIPHKSGQLYYVQLDPYGKAGYKPGDEPAEQLTRFDAEALLRDAKADRQAMMTGGSLAIEPTKAGLSPFYVDSRYTSADFFPMFETPFLYGSGWSKADDDGKARVVVLAKELNEKLFDGENSVGRTVRLDQQDFRVVGVLDEWEPKPRFFDLNTGRFGVEQILVPFSTVVRPGMSRNGSMNCWGETNGDETGLAAMCVWIQYWAELATPERAADYKRYLEQYSDQQRTAGRFERPTNVRLRDVMEWLDFNKVVPSEIRLQVWLAFSFLMVCLVNSVGLLLAKFLRRSGEIGVRRALGASKGAIFMQALVEAGSIGLAGGIIGLGLAQFGLWALRQQNGDLASIAHMDTAMLAATFVLSLVASLVAGLLPAWRACQITPAVQLKAQ